MTSTFPQRVAFEDHRFMRAVDLEDEQLYHLQRRWQHNLALHTWGILCGLEVRINGQKQQQPNVVIHPGMALDGYGRELIVTEVLSVLDSEPNFDPAVTYDVWLSYSVSVDDSAVPVDECAPPGKDCCCAPPDTNLKRILERPEVLVRRTSERQSGSVTQPREVPVGDLFFSPDRPMKFDAASKWPVFLCKLECSRSEWTVDQTERHYGGLIAERIEMPFQTAKDADPQTRQTALLNGGHPERPDWRFAVLDVPAHKDDEPADTRHALPDDVPAPLSIRSVPHRDGTTTETEIRWQAERVVAEADLVMRGGAGIQFETTPAGEFPQAPTSEWGIYRQFRPPASSPAAVVQSQQAAAKPSTSLTAKASDKQYKDANTDQFADVLQISMPSHDEGKNSIAIGAVDADGKFSPVLVVNNDQSVDIFGLLRVHGTIYGDTTDLPPLDIPKARVYFRKWLTDFMASKDPEGKSFVTAVADGADADVLFAGIKDANTPTKVGEVFKLFVHASVARLTAAVVFAMIDKDDDLRKLFVHEAMSTLHAQAVFDTLDKDDDLRKLFVHEAMSTLHAQTVFDMLDKDDDLRKLFVHEAMSTLHSQTVFDTLDKDDDLRKLFVEDAAATLTSADFVKKIAIANQASIITEAFNLRPAASRDGFATANALGRTKVWEMTWITGGLRQEMAQHIPDTDSVVTSFAAELFGANPNAARKLRKALIDLIPLP